MNKFFLLLCIILLLAGIDCSAPTWRDSSYSYKPLPKDDCIIFELTQDSKGHLFAGGKSGMVYISVDDGCRWFQINSGIKDTRVSALAFQSDSLLIVGMHRGGFSKRSFDGIWNLKKNTIAMWNETFAIPTDIRITAISFTGNGKLIVGSDDMVF